MAKEGLKIIISALVGALISVALCCVFSLWWLLLVIPAVAILLFSLYFFRDPKRHTPADPNAIVSPADGTVVLIEDMDIDEFWKGRATKVAIFMSPFNVHVNRIPMDGDVRYLAYKPGKFLPASRKEASIENEMQCIGIENNKTRILFKQVAGIMARRIVCRLENNESVKRGERFGLIKFGSRLDVYFLPEVTLAVKPGQKVKAGETILGVISNE